MSIDGRTHALGELKPLSAIDRFGNWLSIRKIEKKVGRFHNRRIGDFGSGYNAVIARRLAQSAAEIVVVDLSLNPDLHQTSGMRAIEGRLPEAMAQIADGSLDIALCVSVLEHLDEPEEMLVQLRRVTAPGGTVFVNVPSWIGKAFLEFAAFRLQLAPRDEMEDHKRYYDPRDLWPALVAAGFTPSAITCRRHKFGLNTFAVCRVPS